VTMVVPCHCKASVVDCGVWVIGLLGYGDERN
jgi:hypothetical protein